MLEVKVTIDAPELQKAISKLADAICGQTGFPVQNTAPATVAAEVPEPSFVKDAPTDEPEIPAVEQPEQAPLLVNASDAVPVAVAPVAPAPAKKYTFKQISTAGAKLCTDMGKMDALVSLLNSKYGVPAITMIDESRYGELAADLIGLGAVIEEE